MKKLLLFLSVIIITISAMAQQMQPLPIDPKIRKGTLDNGLTYYIRQNVEPKGQAEFFIAQKVGSIQEEDNQRGLAHFLEHMAFNGLKHFPGKDLFKYTEGIGVKFGYNLNAYTSFDETVYNISSVPVSRQGIIDSCLLVLLDWANGLTLLEKDILEERGVIREEMRTRGNATMRIYEEIAPELYPGNRYGHRMPIGTEEVVMGFKPDELRDYYHKWYRPDHQAIVIVGDLDPDYVEGKIKELFNAIPKPATPSELKPIPIEPNEKPIIALGTDPEMAGTQIMIDFKQDPLPKEVKLSQNGLIVNYISGLATSMLNVRLQEIIQKANAPFTGAGSWYSSFFLSKTSDAFSAYATSKEGGMAEAFKAVVTEIARMQQHGFTAGEYERAKEQYLSNLEKAYKERDKRKSTDIARECVRNFEDNEPMPGIEFEYTFANQIAPALPLDAINQTLKEIISTENVVIYGMGPEKEGLKYPTKEELLNIFTTAMATPQTAYVDEVIDEPLMTALPTPGKVTKTEPLALYDAKQFTLSNNVKVIIKPTDFKDDEIVFTATSFGGTSLMENPKDLPTIKMLSQVATLGGVGNFSRVNLTKALAGKRAGVSAGVSVTTEDLNGSCSPKDLETMMQLIYLNVTAPREDQEAFTSWKERMKAQIEGMAAEPMKALQDSLTTILYEPHPRQQPLTVELLNQVDYKRAIELYKERFKDMSDFTFTFVGNIDEKTFIPLMEQYLGSLPNINRKETFKDIKLIPQKGVRKNHFDKEMQTVKATVVTLYTGDVDYTPENRMKFSIFDQILDMVYTEEIREKEGGTYGVSTQCQLSRYPKGNFVMLILFDTDPEKAEHLLSIVYRELEKIANEGPKQEHFEKVIAFMEKDIEESRRENGAWLDAIDEYAAYKTDNFTKQAELLKTIKLSDVQNVAKTILGQKNNGELIMKGVEAKK